MIVDISLKPKHPRKQFFQHLLSILRISVVDIAWPVCKYHLDSPLYESWSITKCFFPLIYLYPELIPLIQSEIINAWNDRTFRHDDYASQVQLEHLQSDLVQTFDGILPKDSSELFPSIVAEKKSRFVDRMQLVYRRLKQSD
jgi:hypothetical protein